MIKMLNVYDLENLKKNINNIYIMASRKYMSRRNKSKGQKRRRTLKRKYGKKRGGFMNFSNLFGSDKKPSSITGGVPSSKVPLLTPAESALIQPTTSASGPAGNTASGDASKVASTLGNTVGGKRRRRRKSSKKSSKGRKSRRKQRGGCIGFAFQPSIVTPPNSALANPAPMSRYTTGP